MSSPALAEGAVGAARPAWSPTTCGRPGRRAWTCWSPTRRTCRPRCAPTSPPSARWWRAAASSSSRRGRDGRGRRGPAGLGRGPRRRRAAVGRPARLDHSGADAAGGPVRRRLLRPDAPAPHPVQPEMAWRLADVVATGLALRPRRRGRARAAASSALPGASGGPLVGHRRWRTGWTRSGVPRGTPVDEAWLAGAVPCTPPATGTAAERLARRIKATYLPIDEWRAGRQRRLSPRTRWAKRHAAWPSSASHTAVHASAGGHGHPSSGTSASAPTSSSQAGPSGARATGRPRARLHGGWAGAGAWTSSGVPVTSASYAAGRAVGDHRGGDPVARRSTTARCGPKTERAGVGEGRVQPCVRSTRGSRTPRTTPCSRAQRARRATSSGAYAAPAQRAATDAPGAGPGQARGPGPPRRRGPRQVGRAPAGRGGAGRSAHALASPRSGSPALRTGVGLGGDRGGERPAPLPSRGAARRRAPARAAPMPTCTKSCREGEQRQVEGDVGLDVDHDAPAPDQRLLAVDGVPIGSTVTLSPATSSGSRRERDRTTLWMLGSSRTSSRTARTPGSSRPVVGEDDEGPPVARMTGSRGRAARRAPPHTARRGMGRRRAVGVQADVVGLVQAVDGADPGDVGRDRLECGSGCERPEPLGPLLEAEHVARVLAEEVALDQREAALDQLEDVAGVERVEGVELGDEGVEVEARVGRGSG